MKKGSNRPEERMNERKEDIWTERMNEMSKRKRDGLYSADGRMNKRMIKCLKQSKMN